MIVNIVHIASPPDLYKFIFLKIITVIIFIFFSTIYVKNIIYTSI